MLQKIFKKFGYVKADKNLLQDRDFWRKQYAESQNHVNELRKLSEQECTIKWWHGDQLLMEVPAKMLKGTKSTMQGFTLEGI